MAKYFGSIHRSKSASELPKNHHQEPYRRISAKDILLGRVGSGIYISFAGFRDIASFVKEKEV